MLKLCLGFVRQIVGEQAHHILTIILLGSLYGANFQLESGTSTIYKLNELSSQQTFSQVLLIVVTRRVLQKFGSDAILAFKSPALKSTNQNWRDFGLCIARPEIDQSEFSNSTIFSVH